MLSSYSLIVMGAAICGQAMRLFPTPPWIFKNSELRKERDIQNINNIN
jgi:hypothetical protein